MAQKIKVYLIDDIDGSDAVDTINFAIDGVNYEIDLNEKHAAELRGAFEKWTTHARKLAGRRTRRSGGARATGTSDAAKIQIGRASCREGVSISAVAASGERRVGVE